MADEELSLDGEEAAGGGGGKKKLIIIIIVALLVLGGGGAAAYFLLFSEEPVEETATQSDEQVVAEPTDGLAATYVAMPRPFVFNVVDGKRDRLVQIKVQLLVRGTDNEALAKKHVPLLEGTLVSVFSAATAIQLRSSEGKKQLRKQALDELNKSTKKLEGKELIDTVLFTGFVLQ